MQALTQTQANGLTARGCASHDVTTLGNLTTDQLAALTATQVHGLTATQLAAIERPAEIQALNATNLSIAQIVGLSCTPSAICPDPLAALTSTEVGALNATQLGGLSSR